MRQNWLANLPLHNCPTCNKQTIFRSGCADCDALETARQDFQDLTAEYKQNAKDIRELQDRQLAIAKELVQIDTKLNGG